MVSEADYFKYVAITDISLWWAFAGLALPSDPSYKCAGVGLRAMVKSCQSGSSAGCQRFPEHLTQARGFFQRALAIDHRTVGALLGIAVADLRMGASLLTDVRAARFSAAETNVVKALSLAPDRALAHWAMGGVYIFTNRAAQGVAECEHALLLDRNLAAVLTALLVWPSILWVSLPRPKAIYSRLSVSRLAI